MGSRGGSSPNGLSQRELRTLFLRVPSFDWPHISQGLKREFRTLPLGAVSSAYDAPTPVVAYTVGHSRRREKLMLLIDHRHEHLVDVSESPASIAAEGFETYDQFRKYWRARTGRPYRPMQKVEVFALAPWPDNQLALDQLGRSLLTRLYGAYLPDGNDDL